MPHVTSRSSRPLLVAVSFVLAIAAPAASFSQEGDSLSLTVMLSGNDGLRAQGMDYVVQQIDFFNRNGSRSSARYFQQEFRWVPGDARRGASGSGLTYLFDGGWSAPEGSGLTHRVVEDAVSRAVETWRGDSCLDGVPLRRTRHAGGDVTVFDFLLGTGGFGDPFAADVVVAGMPAGLEELFGPDTLAFSVTFVFVDGAGRPTDVDGDGHMDTALNEIYFNRALAWSVDGTGFDLETAALHELGHALGLGHFGSPPESAMNPVYRGAQHGLYAIDHAALCVVNGRK